MGNASSSAGAGVANTAPITNTPVANTGAVLGNVPTLTSSATPQNKFPGDDLLDYSGRELWQRLFEKLFPQLRGVTIGTYPDENRLTESVNSMGFGAWTQNVNEIFLGPPDTSSIEEDLAVASAVIAHEQQHILDFRKNLGRPISFEQMLMFEEVAYRFGLNWIYNTAQGALINLFGNDKGLKMYAFIVDYLQSSSGEYDIAFVYKAEEVRKARTAQTPLPWHDIYKWFVEEEALPAIDLGSESEILVALYGY